MTDASLPSHVSLIPHDPRYKNMLGRSVINHDPRNRDFAALEMVQHGSLQPQAMKGWGWPCRDLFNQVDSNCTMEAFSYLLHMPPGKRPLQAKRAWSKYDTEDERVANYKDSQNFDPYPGTDYDGTSSDAPHRRAKSLGETPGFWWLFGEEQCWEFVASYAPFSAGTKWTEDMFNPDARGFVHPTGTEVGGHEWVVKKAHLEGQFYVCKTSWGNWGKWANSEFLVSRADMDALLKDQGDAITIATWPA